jgi:ABC-2 type transport system ATP-binding protein
VSVAIPSGAVTDAPPAPSPAAIDIDGLRVDRGGRPILRDVTLRVPAGRIVGLLGPSGCGKSTLMRSIVGVQIVAAGRVTVLGEPAGSAGLRRRVGYVTQSPSVYADLTVRENLVYFRRIVGAPAEAVDAAIDAVSLGTHADRLAGSLSGGQRIRVSLAAALLGRPELLVLDEPTVGLDPVVRRQLWELFRGFADDGATILVSSHVMDEADRCERLLLMREGSIIASDTPEGLRARTGAPDVERAFLTLVENGGPS